MGGNDVFRDEEAVSRRVGIHFYGILPVAAFGEEALLVFRRDAHARILYGEDNLSGLLRERDTHTSRRRVIDGVFDEVPEHVIAELIVIAIHRVWLARGIDRKVEREILLRGRFLQLPVPLLGERLHVERFLLVLHGPLLLVRRLKNLDHRAGAVARRRERALDKRLHAVRQRPVIPFRKSRECTHVFSQKSFDFMPHEMDKTLLPAIGFLELMRKLFYSLALIYLSPHASYENDSDHHGEEEGYGDE